MLSEEHHNLGEEDNKASKVRKGWAGYPAGLDIPL